jgi:F-type H+-transporting ATPase subunit gamma
MASTRQILQRRKAVENIRRITRTMEMISTARYKSYLNKRIAVMDYRDALASMGYLIATSPQPLEHPLMKENKSGHSVVLAIGSIRGLCGQYNESVYRMLEVHINNAKKQNRKLDVHATESRLLGILSFHGITPAKIYTGFEEVPPDEMIELMASDFVKQYIAGTIDYFGIVYMNYFSMTSQRVQTLTVMPVVEMIEDLATSARAIWPWELTFEDFFITPSVEEVIEEFATMLIRYTIKTCFMNAALSEHVARMIAMRNATDNADEVIKELTGQYNRARQAGITGELLDIIGGTGVLE